VKAPWLPPGRPLGLPGRGTAFVRHLPAPAGRPTVLLLHGIGITSDIQWCSTYPALAERYGIVALDHRGHGRGIRSRDPFTVVACADDAASALAELGVERAVVVGYSMGGPVAQELWHRHPQRTAGLVLCAGAHSYRGYEPAGTRVPALTALTRVLQTARFLAARVDPDLRRWMLAELRRTDRRYVYEAGLALGRFDSSAWIGGVDVPHAVVVTELDADVDPERQRQVADALPAATVHPCQADHGACVTPSNHFLPALLEALEQVAG
jgi:pimeloyl-ACP methyl ester carboxylesterase